jgi:hypothetical protein
MVGSSDCEEFYAADQENSKFSGLHAPATNIIRGVSPLGLPHTLSCSPLRRLAPFAWLTPCARSRVVPATSPSLVRELFRRLRPSDSLTRSLARRFAGLRRSRGSLAALVRESFWWPASVGFPLHVLLLSVYRGRTVAYRREAGDRSTP